MINNLLLAVHNFTKWFLISLSIDEILPPRYVNWSKVLEVCHVEWNSFYFRSYGLCFIYIHVENKCCILIIITTQQRKKTSEDLFNKIYTSHFIVTFVCERELKTEHNCNILTLTLMAVSVVSFSFSRAAQPVSQRLTLCWLSLLHLISNFSGPQLFWLPTQSGAPRAPSVWCGFLYHISSITPTVDFLSWLSYIIVQHPLNHQLNLWNGMFDRHQAEITVMQFIGHSLPVYQSISVPWDFFTLTHFLSQARLRDFLS